MNHGDIEAKRPHLNELSRRVIGLCREVHRELGPGLLESAYQAALAHELTLARIPFEQQRATPLLSKGVKLDCGYRIDLIVAGELIVELKTVADILPIHRAQLLTYRKLERRSLGLVVNFNVPVLKDGFRRVICGDLFHDERPSRTDFDHVIALLGASVSLWFKSSGM